MEKSNFYKYLERIENIGSTIEKENLLIGMLTIYPESEEFLRITFNGLVYNIGDVTFWKAFSSFNLGEYPHISDYLNTIERQEEPIDIIYPLQYLKSIIFNISEKSGNALVDYIYDEFKIMSKLQKKWWCRALLHDLRMGANLKTINGVFKFLNKKPIEKYDVQLCGKVDIYDEGDVRKHISFPCIMECKYDGIRLQANLFWDGQEEHCTLTSRRGKDKTQDYPDIVDELTQLFVEQNVILDGEIIARSFQSLTRKDDTSQKKFVVFDLLLQENLPYINRWDNLVNLLMETGIAVINDNLIGNTKEIPFTSVIQLSEHYSANDIQDLRAFYEDLNDRGEEGIIIKLANAPYERGTRRNMFKCKKTETADLLIIGWNKGEGKRANGVGSLKLIDKSGTIKVDVGSGIDDITYEELTQQIGQSEQDFIGKICEIKFNEITETGSIRFPRFICIREDKTEADDLSIRKVRQGE